VGSLAACVALPGPFPDAACATDVYQGWGRAIADAVVRATNGRWDVGTSPAGGASMAVSWPRLLAHGASTRAVSPESPPLASLDA